MFLLPYNKRVQRFLDKLLRSPAYRWEDVHDPRHRRGRRWTLSELLSALFLGMLAGCRSLEALEALTEDALGSSLLNLPRRLPDTTLYHLIPRLSAEDLRDKLVQQIRSLYRSKRFMSDLLPCGIVAIDGKCSATLIHESNYAYFMALKENQPELYREAHRVLDPKKLGKPEAVTPWEKSHGKWVRRCLYRTTVMEGYLGWVHLKQVISWPTT